MSLKIACVAPNKLKRNKYTKMHLVIFWLLW